MSWPDDLATWLAGPPRPHDPPAGASSCYAWLREHGSAILLQSSATPRSVDRTIVKRFIAENPSSRRYGEAWLVEFVDWLGKQP